MRCAGGGCVYPILPGPVGDICSDIPGANEVRPHSSIPLSNPTNPLYPRSPASTDTARSTPANVVSHSTVPHAKVPLTRGTALNRGCLPGSTSTCLGVGSSDQEHGWKFSVLDGFGSLGDGLGCAKGLDAVSSPLLLGR